MGKPRKKIIYIPKQTTGNGWFGLVHDFKQEDKLSKEREKVILKSKK